jgi:hypothetical protein
MFLHTIQWKTVLQPRTRSRTSTESTSQRTRGRRAVCGESTTSGSHGRAKNRCFLGRIRPRAAWQRAAVGMRGRARGQEDAISGPRDGTQGTANGPASPHMSRPSPERRLPKSCWANYAPRSNQSRKRSSFFPVADCGLRLAAAQPCTALAAHMAIKTGGSMRAMDAFPRGLA